MTCLRFNVQLESVEIKDKMSNESCYINSSKGELNLCRVERLVRGTYSVPVSVLSACSPVERLTD